MAYATGECEHVHVHIPQVSASVALSEEVYAMAPKALLAADASAGAEALQV